MFKYKVDIEKCKKANGNFRKEEPKSPNNIALAHKVDRIGKLLTFSAVAVFNLGFWVLAIRKYAQNTKVENFF